MSDTPRTDEAERKAHSPYGGNGITLLTEHGRQLERELAAATRKPEPLSAPTHEGYYWVWHSDFQRWIHGFANTDAGLFICDGWNRSFSAFSKWLPCPEPEDP